MVRFNILIEQDEDGWFVSEVVELPRLSAIELSKILKKLGFQSIRQEGSHSFLDILMEGQPLFLNIQVKI